MSRGTRILAAGLAVLLGIAAPVEAVGAARLDEVSQGPETTEAAETTDTTEEAPGPEDAARPREGAETARLALLPVEVDGGADEGVAARLAEHLREGFARSAVTLVEPAAVAAILGDGACDGACVRALGREEGADYVLRARIAVDDRDYIVSLDLIATEDGEVAAQSRETCDLCGFVEVGQLLEAQAVVLRGKLEELIRSPPVLELSTDPPGALIFIDGELVGTSPIDRTMLAGDHILRITHDGYVTEELEVTMVDGIREVVGIRLWRSPESARLRATGWATLGVGIPAVAGGIALLALHGRPVGPCDGLITITDADGQVHTGTGTNFTYEPIVCERMTNTRWGGAVALAGGAALITAGIMLLLRTRDRRAKPGREARIRPQGFGIAGRF